MNWIKRLFSKKQTTKQCDIHVVSCSLTLEEQVYRKINDYDRLIDSQYEFIRIGCRKPIVSWGKEHDEMMDFCEKGATEIIDHYEKQGGRSSD